MNSWEASVWALSEFGAADLGHAARTKRLVQMATDLMQSPASSLPKAIGDPAQAKGAYRFLSNPEVNPQGILSGHYHKTAMRCLGSEAVLVLQDTTTLKFNSRAAIRDLGPTNDGSNTKGFLAHSSLAVGADTHDVHGVLHQHIWIRSRKKKPANETSRQRKKRRCESEHWGDNQKCVAQVLCKAVGEGGQHKPRIIAVFDREGDVFEAMETLDALDHSFVIRAQRNRLLDNEEPGVKRYSLDEVRTAAVVAHKLVELRARAGHGARTARLEVRATTATLKPPRARGRKGQSMTINIVLALEVDAPPEVTPLCWYLVTREPVATAADVLQVIRHYEARWIIEEFHMGLKTGCACEARQMETAHALINFLAVATPMAVQLLQLRDAARRDVPLEECHMLGPSEMKVLRGLRPRMMAKVTNARQLMRVVANFGGFLNRNPDPDPGWRTLWRGFEAVKLAAKGYDLRGRSPEPLAASGAAGSRRKRFG